MIPNTVIQETEQRFEYRTPERTETEEKLKSSSKLLADDPERVEKRLKRLLRGEFASEVAAVVAAPAISAAGVSVGTEPLALERILNKNNLMSINYLERGLGWRARWRASALDPHRGGRWDSAPVLWFRRDC